MSKPENIYVVSASDNNYAMPLAVMLCSAADNLADNKFLKVFIIDNGITASNKERIFAPLRNKRVIVKWLTPIKYETTKLPSIGHMTDTTYQRIFIADLLPKTLDRVIYLDCDIIILGDLYRLWKTPFSGNLLMAVQDMGEPYVSSPRALSNYVELGLSSNTKYFNAGVLLIDLNKWRKNQTGRCIFEYMKSSKTIPRWCDQDGLNAVLSNYWGELDPRWNQIPHIYDYSSWHESPFDEEVYTSIISDPFIVHFATSSKPWLNGSTHPKRKLFYQYLDKTAWSGWRSKKTPNNQLPLKIISKTVKLFKQFVQKK